MDPLLNIALPALFAGLVAVGVTVAIERWGGRLGGLIGTLPSTILPASLGIWAQSASDEAFRAAMFIVPLGMLLDAVFLYLWRVLPPKLPKASLHARLALMAVVSLAIWFGMAWLGVLGMQWLRGSGWDLAWVGVGATVLMAALGALACLGNPPSPAGRKRVGPLMLLSRGALAASAIGVAVVLAGLGGDLAAGMASVFPAIFLTTMVALWLSQGEAVQAGAVGPMMLGATSVAAFAVLSAFTFPAFGPALGTVLAWIGAAGGATLPAWIWLSRPTSEPDPPRLDA